MDGEVCGGAAAERERFSGLGWRNDEDGDGDEGLFGYRKEMCHDANAYVRKIIRG